MASIRKPWQGVTNIVRFNWHFYVLIAVVLLLLFILRSYLSGSLLLAVNVLLVLSLGTVIISLAVSCYIYDHSHLYSLSWLDDISTDGPLVNIHAGFDETSVLLRERFANTHLQVLDFYDPAKHTEVSIKRARKAYPPYPGTQTVQTQQLPLADHSAHTIFVLLAAHEIRNGQERIAFFKELARALQNGGQVVVTEHLRDTANFLVYNIGAFHFHSRAAWLRTFNGAGLAIRQEISITPFIRTFILQPYGTAS